MNIRSTNRWYILFVLTLVYAFNHVDRQVMVILSEPIKLEFGLSDTQLGMLTGFLFAAFYATLGIPFAIWADRGNRRNIIALALTIWSGMTAISGFAGSFIQLAFARMGVGIGEAGGTPPATAMIADLFPPKRRALALGIYTTGISLGILIGFILGGAIAAEFGWRSAFFVAGVPGLILAAILLLTVAEPKRGQSENRVQKSEMPSVLESLVETAKFFVTQRAMVSLLLGGVFVCVSANAFLSGIPLYLIRVHEVPIAELGVALGLLMGGLGGIGAISIGALCDKFSQKDLRWRPWTILITGLIAFPFIVWFLYAPDKQTAYWVYTIPGLFGLLYASISYTAMQELVPVRMRAMASAVMLLCMTLIGIGFGPVIMGLISDFYAAELGRFSIQRALTWMLAFNVLSIVFYLDAARHYRAGVARAISKDTAVTDEHMT